MTIKLTPVSRARTWLVRLDVEGAPDTKRDYSDHWIAPQRLEISYTSVNGQPPRMSSVRMTGTRPKASVIPSNGGNREAFWHDIALLPEWIRPIVQEYTPT
jgi:hypothetical protein